MKKKLAFLTIFIVSFSLGILGTTYLPNHIFGYGFILLWHIMLLALISIILSIIIKKVFKLNIHFIYIIALSSSIISVLFFLNNYVPTYTIDLSNKPVDKVVVYVWKNEENNLETSNRGVIYISYKTYKRGFRYRIIKNGIDMTGKNKNLKGFSAMPFPNDNNDYFLYKTLSSNIEAVNDDLLIKDYIHSKYVDKLLLYKQKVIN